MTKLAKKISAVVMAGVVTACVAVSVSAADDCPHKVLLKDDGVQTYSYSYYHAEGCVKTENRYKYTYTCVRCEKIISTTTEVRFKHSNPDCPGIGQD